MRHGQFDIVAVGRIIDLCVAAIIDRIALEACADELADDVGKAQASVMGGLKAGFGNGNPFRVHAQFLSSAVMIGGGSQSTGMADNPCLSISACSRPRSLS